MRLNEVQEGLAARKALCCLHHHHKDINMRSPVRTSCPSWIRTDSLIKQTAGGCRMSTGCACVKMREKGRQTRRSYSEV